MGRKSSITKLTPEVRAELDQWLVEGRHTIQEVVEHLESLGCKVSWSAVQRYNVQLEDVARDIRMSREMAQAISRELADVPDGDNGRLVIESMQALLLRVRMQMAQGEEVSVKEVAAISGAVRDLQAALRMNVDTEMKIRDRVAKEAAEAVVDVGTERGVSTETINAIKERVLGIRKQ
jgi:hypothetical protein